MFAPFFSHCRRKARDRVRLRIAEESEGDLPEAVGFALNGLRPILPIVTYETPFAFRVEAHPQRQGRYLWAIGYGFQTYRRSSLSFATRREAENDALKAMSKIEAHWRRERDPSAASGRAQGGKGRLGV
jgi:hypothetical protein